MLFLDLDRFKIVNDSLGHETGDAVLKEVGNRFVHGVRAGETAARFSGDEFVFIIRDVHGVTDAVGRGKAIAGLVGAPDPLWGPGPHGDREHRHRHPRPPGRRGDDPA